MLHAHQFSLPFQFHKFQRTSNSTPNWSYFFGFQAHFIFLTSSPFKPIFDYHSFSSARVVQIPEVKLEEEGTVELSNEKEALKQKLEVFGIDYGGYYSPGQYTHLVCPKCKGGLSVERSLSLHINQNKNFAMWRCFRFECGWAGQVFADITETQAGVNKISEVNLPRQMTEETLRLEPLGDQLTEYFADRMISKKVLQKNAVMQTLDDKSVIAFTYRRNGVIVNCKYRSITTKKFWQVAKDPVLKEKGAERILYGLDGIKEAEEIIIVEGEIDKLSMEQAGILNCVSVPDGAPQKVSKKVLPSLEQDTRFKYLWNCKEYLDKATRIILATDGDRPGQVLAEELARRLGRERCWLVTWPKKDEASCFKDANEVLKNFGADALRHIVENVELYQVQNLE